MRRISRNKGLTLVEIMIAVAIVSILFAIAIPAYQGYVETSQRGAARANTGSIRTALEDFWLDNGNYGAGGANKAALLTTYGWEPEGDQGEWSYSVTVPGAASDYDITVTHNDSGKGVTCPKDGACTEF